MLHKAFGVLGLVEGLSFLFMSALHAGVFGPLFGEPVIVPCSSAT